MNPFVEGVVQRVKPAAASTNQLKKASVRDRPTIYANNGIWQDAIATLDQERCTKPHDQNLLTSWTRLLQLVQLKDFAQEPLTLFCSAKPAQK